MKAISPSRNLCRVVVALAAVFALPCLAQKLETSMQEIGCSRSNDLHSGYEPRYRALREFKDPGTHQDWLLIRDQNRATGPALLVRESPLSACAFLTLDKSIRGAEFQLRVRSIPVIHAGDHIVLLEHTTVSDAALEATALEAAAARRCSPCAHQIRRPYGSRDCSCARPRHSRLHGERVAAMKRFNVISSFLILAIFGLVSAELHATKKQKATETTKTPPELALHAYIDRVRAQNAAQTTTAGSIWVSDGRLVRFGTDAKAARLHDVISIVVIESLAASTDGQVKNVRASNASSSVTSLFGALKVSNNLQNLVGQNSSSGLTAQGQSTTNSSLATTFGGEVVDVLPNGMLVVQATRQLTFSQQTQLIKLRGLVRPEDVSAQNQVLSTAMTDLELEVTGKGIVSDSTYRQNPLVRLLEKLLVF